MECGALTTHGATLTAAQAPSDGSSQTEKSTAAPKPGATTAGIPAVAATVGIPSVGATAGIPSVTPDFKKTMLGMARAPEPAGPVLAAPVPSASPAPLKSTMIGLAAPAIGGPQGPAPAAAPAYNPSKTMLGVALPGIAPLRPGETTQAVRAPAPTPTPQPRRLDLPRGVDGPLPPILPAPEPLSDVPAPAAPRIVRKSGVPLVAVASATAALVAIVGAAVAFLWRGAPPISALPRVTPEGNDVLHLVCDPASCRDGTTVALDGASAAFASGSADLQLVRPLHVGDNPLSLRVDRPGMGRDEVIALSVPIAYRVRADLTTMYNPHPSIAIHVEALAGSDVRVADKPVALDGDGNGTYVLDEASATEGPADESHEIAVDVPYTVAVAPHGGEPARPMETGTVSARVAVAPLRVDAPVGHAVVNADHFLIAGRAAKGASVTVNGQTTATGVDGTFEADVPLRSLGETSVEVRSSTAGLAPRTVHVPVKRTSSLADEARAFEKQGNIGYDTAMSNLAANTGKTIVLDGEVIEPRVAWHRTLLLMDDRRGCAKGPCPARVIVSQDLPIAQGERLRAYGRIARAFATPGGQTVPEVEADFVLRAKR